MKLIYKNNLVKIRNNNNETQKDLDKLLCLKGEYGHYEREDKIIPLKHLNKICNHYNVSLDYIFGFTNETKYKNMKNDVNTQLICSRLKEFRKENNISQKILASDVNLSISQISRYELGKDLISTETLYLISDKYKISADYLLGKTDFPKNII